MEVFGDSETSWNCKAEQGSAVGCPIDELGGILSPIVAL
jgi:hypothetical protein